MTKPAKFLKNHQITFVFSFFAFLSYYLVKNNYYGKRNGMTTQPRGI
ncbi:MAG: hypothetical protein MRECE_30c012 [Mycoplasmataceae bacterium CE_OT135]|nr:MAG: hypothetical protein MRECE_30c012 [Mycoplasmataceae bacterium CE_OT135]